MALSEHEQRLLDELELQLKADDPKLANTFGSARPGGFSTRRILIGALITLAGIATLIFGISIQLIVVGVLGFVVMGLGVWFATSRTSKASAPKADGPKRQPATTPKSKFMSDLENKWDERRRDQ
ncbi:DUF3040 domain-containing protein [Haematomicrobium sanguinis]|uniref:DUF3040 domain-containing protein n=1 Tax=Haematomicrobium sanguinis TaxID=479106 RepID=UPI00047B4FEE|nr:DUF3040 domain-containing protein [Haematomicrobium sanguinis]